MIDFYPVDPQAVGFDTIALSEFGGDQFDPVGAILRVDGWRRVVVRRPRFSGATAAEDNARFQDAVRELALTYEFRAQDHGPVDIVWKPANGTGMQYDVPGEPVDRVI